MEYIIPELSTSKALQFSADINTIDFSDIDQMTFIANMKWVRPFGMLLASNAIKQLRNSYPDVPFHMHCSINRDGISYAGHMGFFKAISESIPVGNSPGEAMGNDNYLPITELNLYKLHADDMAAGIHGTIGDTIERKSSELAKIISRNDAEMLALMTYLIREILRNIPEHSNSSNAWICGQYWSDHTAEIAIVDEGIGIRQSLQKNAVHRQYVVDNETALRCSIKAGISQAFNPSRGNKSYNEWSNSGYGLYMASEICKKLQGSFCIASGNSFLNICQDGKIDSGKTHFKGTAIKMNFSTSRLSTSNDIIREIASEGELEARTIKNAFKKASHPSKGLILEL
ncbi:hypothetical protein [Oscillibacter sp.]|uniref:hypothetical protein n=1 Tax=Oscillibacter sp. TaxID=1945593 RepID=UPI0028AF973E|nr:hypothetical protein [Oscillibacter sp.]